MAKNALFVGDERPLWQDFRQHLAAGGAEWGADFAKSGQQALAFLVKSSYASVIADAQLSDMSGLDLLDEVMVLQPASFRIVMSDLSDTTTTIQCLGKGHHFLSAPCDVNTLLNAMDRPNRVQTWLPSMDVRTLIAQMRHVPSPPTIYFQIVSELASENASLERVAEIISQDPAITAKILQLANSAVFGLQLEIIEPAEAVAYVGLETTKSLVLLAHSFSGFEEIEPTGFSMEALWSHSLVAGRFARQIAEREDSPRVVSDQSFTAGLLHDIGKLLLAANLPSQFAQVIALTRAHQLSLCDAEKQVLGSTHADLGGALLCIWGIPTAIVEAVALHHEPSRLPPHQLAPLTAAHAANVFAHTIAPGTGVVVPSDLDRQYLQQLGLDAHVDSWRNECLSLFEGAPR